MNDLLPIELRDASWDAQSASLIESIRNSLMIQAEMFRRILDSKPSPSLLLAEMLEETGNRYLDFSALVSIASKSPSGPTRSIYPSVWNVNGSWPRQ